ncbi:MAG: alpha-L-rhamnosidase, partial [bacterium]|nr:alpha-L-rhamnosidase [bacterium]
MTQLISVPLFLLFAGAASAASVGGLRSEYKTNPVGIDARQPRLSWQLRSDERGAVQKAYQIQVTAGGDTVWDTGRVDSDQSIHVPYTGPALASAQRYSWRVRIWDGEDAASDWSEPAFWEMGLLDSSDWTARWIAPDWDEDTKTSQPAPMLRTEFDVRGAVKSARAYVTSLGLYEMEMNGARVGDELF